MPQAISCRSSETPELRGPEPPFAASRLKNARAPGVPRVGRRSKANGTRASRIRQEMGYRATMPCRSSRRPGGPAFWCAIGLDFSPLAGPQPLPANCRLVPCPVIGGANRAERQYPCRSSSTPVTFPGCAVSRTGRGSADGAAESTRRMKSRHSVRVALPARNARPRRPRPGARFGGQPHARGARR